MSLFKQKIQSAKNDLITAPYIQTETITIKSDDKSNSDTNNKLNQLRQKYLSPNTTAQTVRKKTKLTTMLVGTAFGLMLLNGGLIGTVYFKNNSKTALANQNFTLSANCRSLLNGGVALSNDKIVTIDKNNELGFISKETSMVNGSVIQPNGNHKTRDGVEKKLESGQILDFQGNFIPAKECENGLKNIKTDQLKPVELKTK